MINSGFRVSGGIGLFFSFTEVNNCFCICPVQIEVKKNGDVDDVVVQFSFFIDENPSTETQQLKSNICLLKLETTLHITAQFNAAREFR